MHYIASKPLIWRSWLCNILYYMKNQKLKNYFVLLLLVLVTAESAQAKAPKTGEDNWAEIFATEITKSRSNLGQQCLIKTDSAYKTYKKEHADKDLEISNADFVAQMQTVGLYAANYNISQYYETSSICYLTQNEYLAIRMYTGAYYQKINSALRSLNLQQIKDYRLLIKFLIAGLNKLENYVGVTKRGTNLKSQLTAHCEAGAAFADRGFMSTSISSGFGGQYRFVLASKSCKYVMPYSSFPNEEEVLCLPGTVFQVRYMNDGPSGKEVILQEVGQRFDIDDLIQSLENHPEAQNPDEANYWSQSCQSGELIFEEK